MWFILRVYNLVYHNLAERLNWFEGTRTPVNVYPLNVSVVPVERIYQNIPEFRIQTQDGRKKDSNDRPITKKGLSSAARCYPTCTNNNG